jgi:glutamine amidotransferase
MNKKVVVIDYQLGNLFSVNQALINIGLDVKITSDPEDVINADAIVLPGVGAFKDAMVNLKNMGLIEPIKNSVESGKTFLGICLGLQLLFTKSEEFGSSEGLNIIPGEVIRFKNDTQSNLKVPQIAWNTINQVKKFGWEETPLYNISNGEDMYFVHSYYVKPDNDEVILTETTYGGLKYASSIFKDNIFACQFHPEKSANEGLKLYKNWAYLNNLL